MKEEKDTLQNLVPLMSTEICLLAVADGCFDGMAINMEAARNVTEGKPGIRCKKAINGTAKALWIMRHKTPVD